MAFPVHLIGASKVDEMTEMKAIHHRLYCNYGVFVIKAFVVVSHCSLCLDYGFLPGDRKLDVNISFMTFSLYQG